MEVSKYYYKTKPKLPITDTVIFLLSIMAVVSPLTFLSLSNGPTHNRTVLFIMDEKSSCLVMQLTCSMLPLSDILLLTCAISRPHLYLRASVKFSTTHSPHVHIQNQNKQIQKCIMWCKDGMKFITNQNNWNSLIQVKVLLNNKWKNTSHNILNYRDLRTSLLGHGSRLSLYVQVSPFHWIYHCYKILCILKWTRKGALHCQFQT